MQPSPIFLAGQSHGQKSLVGDSPCLKEMCLIKCDFYMPLRQNKGFPGGTSGKEPAIQKRIRKRTGLDTRTGKIPWRRLWQPTPEFLPEESH